MRVGRVGRSEARERMRPRTLLVLMGAVAAATAIVVLVAVRGECGGTASCPATATVDGRTYLISIARSLQVEPDEVDRYGTVSRHASGLTLLDDEAYRLGEIDPTRVLVLKLAPGQVDDAGPLGGYLLLVSDSSSWPLTCPYFAPVDPLRPTVCD